MRYLLVCCSFLVPVLLLAGAVALEEEDLPTFRVVDPEDTSTVLGAYHLLDWNSTDDATVLLASSMAPPFEELEPFRLAVLWPTNVSDVTGTSHWNASAGMDQPVRMDGAVRVGVLWDLAGTAPPNATGGDWWMAQMYIGPLETHEAVVGSLDDGNTTLALRREVEVVYTRAHITFSEVEGNNYSFEELNRTDVPVRIDNWGSRGHTDVVLDVRYLGRIVATVNITYLPAQGNRTVSFDLTPVWSSDNEDWLDLHIVRGPDAPKHLGRMGIEVRPRSIIEVVAVAIDDTTPMEGSRVWVHATVRNAGNLTSVEDEVEFLVDGTVKAKVPVGRLEPGGEARVDFTWHASGPGVHSIAARVPGAEYGAMVGSLDVKAETPGPGAGLVLLVFIAAGRLTRAARRSS